MYYMILFLLFSDGKTTLDIVETPYRTQEACVQHLEEFYKDYAPFIDAAFGACKQIRAEKI